MILTEKPFPWTIEFQNALFAATCAKTKRPPWVYVAGLSGGRLQYGDLIRIIMLSVIGIGGDAGIRIKRCGRAVGGREF